MRQVALLATLLAAGCDSSPRVDEDKVNTQMLERVAFQRNEIDNVGRSARLQPIDGVIAPPGYVGPICRFSRDGDTLVFALSASAAARVNGVLRVFRAGGPVGPDGGYFRDRELALSIGVVSGLPAQARVSNRLTDAREDVEGSWECRR